MYENIRVPPPPPGSFLKVNIQNRDIFLGCRNSKYFLGVLQIPDFFFGGEW